LDVHRRANRPLSDNPPSALLSSHPPVLALNGITKHFGKLTALDDVTFAITKGKIHALLGENGAGKTTLMRVAFGMLKPDSGSISVDGRVALFASPADAIVAGVGMVHQQFSLVPAMTVAENVALGGRGSYSFYKTARLLVDVAKRTGLELDPAQRVADLGNADRQKLEIIRTLMHDAKVMILDEPTAVLTPKDTGELFAQLRAFANSGGAVVLITHKLADAVEHADDVTVLRHGKVVLSSPMSDVNETTLAVAMLGSPLAKPDMRVTTAAADRELIASINDDSVSSGKSATSLQIKAGEIIGIAALDGAATELLRALAGRSSAFKGAVKRPSRIGFVPENRQEEALIGEFTLTENLALASAGERHGLMNWRELASHTSALIEEFNVQTKGPDQLPAELSGGNQQRFVLGRELRDNPSLLILENPTQGLDLNAATFVHSRMKEARDNGSAIVFYSSDLDELAELSDRVFVISRSGFTQVEPDRNRIGNALLGRSD
jgi:simple sugar transport system ATP-binding protein